MCWQKYRNTWISSEFLLEINRKLCLKFIWNKIINSTSNNLWVLAVIFIIFSRFLFCSSLYRKKAFQWECLSPPFQQIVGSNFKENVNCIHINYDKHKTTSFSRKKYVLKQITVWYQVTKCFDNHGEIFALK